MRETAETDVATLVERHHAELYRYAYRLTGRTADAEDLTQQTFLIAQQKLDQLRDEAHARAWLFTILRNSYLKGRMRRGSDCDGRVDLDLESLADDVSEPTEIDGERLQLALLELREEFRTVLMMFYFEELSYREIASQLDLPDGTVMSRLARAKQHLRARLVEAEAVGSVRAVGLTKGA